MTAAVTTRRRVPMCEHCHKRAHRTYRSAVAAALHDSAVHGYAYRIYPCPVHRGYHLTTQPRYAATATEEI